MRRISSGSSRKGWTAWAHEWPPGWDICWTWPGARPLHRLKENRTGYFVDGELVGEVRWRQLQHLWRMKRPPPGWEPREIDYAKVLAEAGEWHAARRAGEAGKPPD